MIRDTKRSIQMETSFYDYTDKFQHNNNKNRYHQVQHRTYSSQEPYLLTKQKCKTKKMWYLPLSPWS